MLFLCTPIERLLVNYAGNWIKEPVILISNLMAVYLLYIFLYVNIGYDTFMISVKQDIGI